MKIGRIQRRAGVGERLSGAAPARLAMDVLGGLGLSVGARRLPLESKKGRALLAFLALDGRGMATRERLTSLFWPEAGEKKADGSFRQVLNDIDRALAACGCAGLERLPGAIQLDRGMIDLDLDGVLAAIAQGVVPAVLEKAGSCADRLLDGYETMPADFVEWLEEQRRVTHGRLLRALEAGYEGEGLPAMARRRLAEAALRMDPLHEAACRVVMLLAAEAGEYGPAIKVYEALYEAMGVDLDMEPSEPTQELVARVKQGQVEAVAARGG
jgi:DNA-binding SARP family transcriptional activator